MLAQTHPAHLLHFSFSPPWQSAVGGASGRISQDFGRSPCQPINYRRLESGQFCYCPPCHPRQHLRFERCVIGQQNPNGLRGFVLTTNSAASNIRTPLHSQSALFHLRLLLDLGQPRGIGLDRPPLLEEFFALACSCQRNRKLVEDHDDTYSREITTCVKNRCFSILIELHSIKMLYSY